jgi:ribosomal protein S18 acetylase RimI-like enzyme
MYLRRITPADHRAVADFLDERTFMLRWLVAFFRHQDRLPEGEESYWSLWVGARDQAFSCVAAHFFQNGTTYLCATPEADWTAVEILCEEDLLPERLVGDRDVLDRWKASSSAFFDRAGETKEVDVLAFGQGDEAPQGFRAATREDLGILEQYGQQFSLETGSDTPSDFDSLVENGLAYVFEEQGKVAGFVRSNLSDGRYVHAGGIYVHPAYRGKGVGRALALGIGATVRGSQGATVLLDVNRENERAYRAYRAAGYEKVGSGLEVLF